LYYFVVSAFSTMTVNLFTHAAAKSFLKNSFFELSSSFSKQYLEAISKIIFEPREWRIEFSRALKHTAKFRKLPRDY
ncbi:MAG: hypothetical protein M3R14_08420, partial [Acidobacteriota bacterium]|nr:hypothetical protein [Acidobacteriota bacterium]